MGGAGSWSDLFNFSKETEIILAQGLLLLSDIFLDKIRKVIMCYFMTIYLFGRFSLASQMVFCLFV